MNKLISFDQFHLQNINLEAELELSPLDFSRFILKYSLRDSLSEISLSTPSFVKSSSEIERRDELWKGTCFEMFLNVAGQNQYYEFNFSLDPAWQCYYFQGYRFPQPPTLSHAFEIEQMIWSKKNETEHDFEVRLKNHSEHHSFNVGFAATIKDTQNQTGYFSLKHEKSKPDFHLKESFILKRGSNV